MYTGGAALPAKPVYSPLMTASQISIQRLYLYSNAIVLWPHCISSLPISTGPVAGYNGKGRLHVRCSHGTRYHISSAGIECAGHTHTHPELDTLPLSQVREEIVQCKQLLEQHIGQEVLSFAYPYGYHTTGIKQLVKEAGYTSACAVKYEMSSETTDHFALARLIVSADMSVGELANALTQGTSSVITLSKRLATPLWRLARQSSNALTTRGIFSRMTDTKLDASVVICAYTEKRWDDLIAAIESVQQQSIPAREIILVVDHNPALLTRVHANFPTIIGIENSEPQGLSGARNSGIAIAKGTLVAFLDDDAMAEPDWLARLCHCCEDPQVMGTGGTVNLTG